MTRLAFILLITSLAASCTRDAAVDVYALDDEAYKAYIGEQSVRDYDPKAEHPDPPRKGELVRGVDLRGKWDTAGGFDYTAMTFEPLSDGRFSVRFETFGCLLDWRLDRTATYAGSKITFDRPVKDYPSGPYTTMYTFTFEGETYLIASENVKWFDEHDEPIEVHEAWLLKKRTDAGDGADADK